MEIGSMRAAMIQSNRGTDRWTDRRTGTP